MRGSMVGLKDDNPTIFKEDAKLKGKADDSYAEFGGIDTLLKGATSLRVWSMAWSAIKGHLEQGKDRWFDPIRS
jgi:hypothetical protein